MRSMSKCLTGTVYVIKMCEREIKVPLFCCRWDRAITVAPFVLFVNLHFNLKHGCSVPCRFTILP